MADTQEEIIIIEEPDANVPENQTSQSVGSEDDLRRSKKKRLILIGGGIGFLLLCAGSAVAWYFLSKPAQEPLPLDRPLSDKIKPHEDSSLLEPSQLEKMIAKANTLYANGNQAEALKLYEKIALYSEAISQYNLGVAQLKEGEYEAALADFKHSIANSENRCVSAINAAVCCLHLQKKNEFDYYIDMASAYLPQETASPLYSYYYALINYYKGRYLEALSALKHPTTEEYKATQNKLRAKISSMFGSFDDAINALENPKQEEDSFSLGLLYANIGDLTLAKKYLSDAILQNKTPIEEQLALSMVYLKSGLHGDAASLIKETTDTYPEKVYTPYPIKVFLKPGLFNPDDIQAYYRNRAKNDLTKVYQTIFYFAPYKVFNADQTISYIRKGNANIYIDDISSAKEYLQKSTRSSSIDYGIALAIQKALSFRLREANKQLNDLLKNSPQHSILHYNLGLTYAQLGDFSQAYEHFLRSYHLDANNYLSGIFAIMTAKLISKENPKLVSIVKDNLSNEPEKEEFDLYRTLIDITQSNLSSASKWIDNDYKERPLYLAMKVLIASDLGKEDETIKAAEKLAYLQQRDILPHLMVIDARYKNEKTKAYAAGAIAYMKNLNFRYDDLYFGPQITRERMIHMAAMTGRLTPLIEQLQNKLETTTDNPADITAALAQAHFYNKDFEESYTLYNQIIDTYKVRDEQTLFLGAAASIGAQHYENAIALLELSKIKNPSFLESRYALALLYMQIQNNPGAVIQLTKMGNTGFVSRYFDFAIDTKKLAMEPKKYHPL
ncbi:MAG: tetratricopeptide repeat protein [Sulfuricurvum sp.]